MLQLFNHSLSSFELILVCPCALYWGVLYLDPVLQVCLTKCWTENRTCQKHSSSCSSEWCCPSLPERHIAGSCSAGCLLEPSSSSLPSCFPASYSPAFALIEVTAVKMQDLVFPLLNLMGFLLAHLPKSIKVPVDGNTTFLSCQIYITCKTSERKNIQAYRVSNNHRERFSSKRTPQFLVSRYLSEK